VDPLHGGAVGALGTILVTEDGGKTWRSHETDNAATFFDIFFTDASAGWAVGNAGALYQTTDGGRRWVDRAMVCVKTCTRPADLLRVRFPTPQSGWIVGERGTFFRTVDAGFSWNEVTTQATKTTLYGLSFLDSFRGWAAGEQGTIVQITAGKP
jgi:photosystem II stability/assembly factor-like uncharacterized protein